MMKRVFLLALVLAMGMPAQAATETQVKPAAAAAAVAAEQEIGLNDVRDAGMMLNYIKRQAISIYEEAARPNIDVSSSPEVTEFQTIPQAQLPSKVLPARQEWLVFYLGTMETVIRQLGQEVAEIDKGTSKLTVSKEMEAAISPLYDQWAGRVKQLNQHLDALEPMIDNAAKNNVEIQKVAVAIFDDASRLEETRKSIFAAIRDAAKQRPQDKIILSPPLAN
jgi:hypothetical protein